MRGSEQEHRKGSDQARYSPVHFDLGEGFLRTVRNPGVTSPVSAQERLSGSQLHEIQEYISRRMAQRLHDESAQMLAVIYLDLADIAREAPDHTTVRLAGVVRKLDDVCEQLRSMSHESFPLVLEREGLMAGLQALTEGTSRRSGLELACTGDVDAILDMNLQVVLYRVVQEALSNVVRHAAATRADIHVAVAGARVLCSVRDNGIGIDTSGKQYQRWCGLGLLGVHERVAEVGGKCRMLSRRGKGTELQVELPL